MTFDLSELKPFYDAQDNTFCSLVLENEVDGVQQLLQTGANPNEMFICSASSADVKIAPPLCIAAARGFLKMAEVLCHYGANVNQTDDSGITPLMLALGNGYDEVAQLFVERGASLTAQDDEGIPVIEYAEDNNKMIEYLTRVRIAQIKKTIKVKRAKKATLSKEKIRE